jgi:hypothetical protein
LYRKQSANTKTYFLQTTNPHMFHKTNKILKATLSLVVVSSLIAALLLTALTNTYFSSTFNNLSSTKNASAAGPNQADLIIGKVDNGTTLELSVCVKATPGAIHLTNISTWFTYDVTKMTPSPNIVQEGRYGGNTNGYGALKWQPVTSAPLVANQGRWTLRLDYIGDPATPGQNGVLMNATAPELVGKVKFDKISNPSTTTLDSAKYFSTENLTTEVIFNTVDVAMDCANSACPANTSSASGYNAVNGLCTPTCAPGSFYLLAGSSCQPCPAGSSCAGLAAPATICPAGTYCVASSSTPTNCPNNTTSISNSPSLASCTPTCTAGTYLNDGTYNCDLCPAGFFCYGNVAPFQCPINYYCTGSNTPTGTVVDFPFVGALPPTPCPANTYSAYGSSTVAQCLNNISPIIDMKAFLAGNFSNTTDSMSTTLRTTNQLPSSQPYASAPWYYTGTEILPAANVATDIVDWVLIEVRNGNNDGVIARKAAILKSNGKVIDAVNATNGNTTVGVSLGGVLVTGDYKIIIRHRNHLAIATETNITLTMASSSELDYSNNVNVKSLNQALVGTIGAGNAGASIYALRLADTVKDGSVDGSDRSIFITTSEFAGIYSSRDSNLDGSIDSVDRSLVQNSLEAVEVLDGYPQNVQVQ